MIYPYDEIKKPTGTTIMELEQEIVYPIEDTDFINELVVTNCS
jgi:hypothetical protein